jgi:hypothetical protein
MNRLSDVTNNGRGGVFATSIQRDELRRGFARPDAVFFELDGSKIKTAKQFLIILGQQLKVADLAEAEDWDYLDECLVDLDEFPTAGSFVMFFDQFQRLATAEPGKWETILQVFAHAVEEGQARGKPMYIFLCGEPVPKGFPVIDQS